MNQVLTGWDPYCKQIINLILISLHFTRRHEGTILLITLRSHEVNLYNKTNISKIDMAEPLWNKRNSLQNAAFLMRLEIMDRLWIT